MSRIAAVASALPQHSYPQGEITELIAGLVTEDPGKQRVLRRMHSSSGVETRRLVLPLDEYRDARTFGQTNDRFVVEATRLAATALTTALLSAGVTADEVDLVVFTSVTGISAPSIDALLVPLLGMRTDVKRLPMFGLGCVAGAAGIARVHDYLVGHPDDVAVLLSVELCSLTVQHGDDSMDNIVASGLFGDGAAAVVMLGERRAARDRRILPQIIGTRSMLYPDTRDVIGFRPSETGFRVILTGEVVGVIDRHFAVDAAAFLDEHGLGRDDVDAWIAHPGGPKILEAFERDLELDAGALDRSWRSMAAVGNMSSASVLHVLEGEVAAEHQAGEHGLVFALGPGVSAEFVLLRWSETGGSAAEPAVESISALPAAA